MAVRVVFIHSASAWEAYWIRPCESTKETRPPTVVAKASMNAAAEGKGSGRGGG